MAGIQSSPFCDQSQTSKQSVSSLRSAQFQSTASKQRFHRPAAGEALFTAEKDPKRLAPGRAPVRRHASPVPCASHRMRAGTNSHILVLKHRCLAPAFGCDAQRALRRVVALGPHILVLLAGFFVPSHGNHCFPSHVEARVGGPLRRNPGHREAVEPTSNLGCFWRFSFAIFVSFADQRALQQKLYAKSFTLFPSPESRVPSPESRVPRYAMRRM